MASRSKTKTTMSKLNRERKVLEKRMEKKARKELRKQGALEPEAPEAQEEWEMPDDPDGNGEPVASASRTS